MACPCDGEIELCPGLGAQDDVGGLVRTGKRLGSSGEADIAQRLAGVAGSSGAGLRALGLGPPAGKRHRGGEAAPTEVETIGQRGKIGVAPARRAARAPQAQALVAVPWRGGNLELRAGSVAGQARRLVRGTCGKEGGVEPSGEFSPLRGRNGSCGFHDHGCLSQGRLAPQPGDGSGVRQSRALGKDAASTEPGGKSAGDGEAAGILGASDADHDIPAGSPGKTVGEGSEAVGQSWRQRKGIEAVGEIGDFKGRAARQVSQPDAGAHAFNCTPAPRECWLPVPIAAPVRARSSPLRHFRDRGKGQLWQAFVAQAWGFERGTIRRRFSPFADLSPELGAWPIYSTSFFEKPIQRLGLVGKAESRHPIRLPFLAVGRPPSSAALAEPGLHPPRISPV